jgi:hypothetical protein
MQVAADMRMPITKLFGTSASAGLGNTDQNDMENYNSMVESEVRGKLKYHILRMLEIRCQKLFGFIPNDLEIEFKPLRELSAIDQETVKTQKFTRLQQAKTLNLLSDLEFRDACNKGNLFDVQLDTIQDGLSEDPQLDTTSDEKPDKEVPGADRETSEKPKVSKNAKFWWLNGGARGKKLNSDKFDQASYEADGGDEWISTKRAQALSQLSHIEDSQIFQRIYEKTKRLKFALWLFQKKGGKL